MIQIKIGDCDVNILPVVKGLISESKVINEHYGKYDAYAISLGVEEIEAVRRRSEIPEEEYELSDIDLVYAHRLSTFGEVQTPTPAFCELIDLCTKDNKGVIPLDMNDDAFTSLFIDKIKPLEFVNERRVARKGMKKKMNMNSPEEFVMDWDKHIQTVKGYSRINKSREEYIANQIIGITKYRKNFLVVMELERTQNVIKIIMENV